MNWLRNLLIVGILAITFLLFIRWGEFQERQVAQSAPPVETLSSSAIESSDSIAPPVDRQTTQQTVAQKENASFDPDELPQAPASGNAPIESLPIAQQDFELIEVNTDTLEILIDPKGGDIVKVALPQYLAKKDEPDNPFILLNRTSAHTYIARSGLIGANGTDTSGERPLFSTVATRFELKDGQEVLNVDLRLQQEANVVLTKRFTFTRDSYLVNVEYLIDNQSDQVWSGAIYGQIRRDDYEPPADVGIGMQPFVGAAITTPDTNYKKFDLDELDEETFKVEHQAGWVAMVQHYFLSAWIPDQEGKHNYQLKKLRSKDLYVMEFASELVYVQPKTRDSISAAFYAGPKIIKKLEEISPYLDLTIDFSWLSVIAKPLFITLDFIHSFVGNWGIAIILLTFLVKLVFLYPSAMSYRSMAKMRKVMPQMQELKERYGDDRQRIGQETMKLYKKEGVNPLGGCLPMLMQMPVFISLYWAIMESVELRHSPFFFWITDLSVKDPLFILPLIMGVTMFIQQKLNPAPTDPMQAKVMQLMPIFFTFLFMMFPAGLVLYWVTNNTLSIAQQYLITKKIENS